MIDRRIVAGLFLFSAMIVINLLAGCTKYEVARIFEPEILLVEREETKSLRLAAIGSRVFDDGEGLLTSYSSYLFDGTPPTESAELANAMRQMPRSRDLNDNGRRASLVTVAHEMLAREDRNDVGLTGLHWFLVANDPLTLARRASPGSPSFSVVGLLLDCAFVTQDDLDVEISRIIVLPWSWDRILRTWSKHSWQQRRIVFREGTTTTEFNPPIPLRAVLEQ